MASAASSPSITPPESGENFPQMYEALRTLDVEDIGKPGVKHTAKSLFHPHGAVIYLVRRSGWSLCRDGALELAKLKPDLDALGVRMIALVKERLGAEEFQAKYWPGELYLDSNLSWWKVNNAGSQSILSGLASAFFGQTGKSLAEAKAKGIEMNYKGEGFKRGGVMVVGPGADHGDGMGVLFHHKESNWGARPDNNDVMEAVNKIRATLATKKETVYVV